MFISFVLFVISTEYFLYLGIQLLCFFKLIIGIEGAHIRQQQLFVNKYLISSLQAKVVKNLNDNCIEFNIFKNSLLMLVIYIKHLQ